MKLIFQIFLRDVRHLWRELAVSYAVVIAYGWSTPRYWVHLEEWAATGASGLGVFFEVPFWPRLLVVLVPLAWLVAIVRVVQSDSLVGNRQFWVTRPFGWKQVLAAKISFALICANLPLLILEVYLLAKAGFAPTHYLVGLLWMQCLTSFILLLPVIALATVTATVGQFLLGVLLIVLAQFLSGLPSLLHISMGTSFLSEPVELSQFTSTDPLPTILLLAFPLVIIGLQYARRRTLLSRWLIVCLMAALVLITLFAPYRTLVHRQYPPLNAGEKTPIHLAIGGTLGTWTRTSKPDPNEVGIVLPLTIERTSPDFFLIMKGSHVEVESQNGLKWDAGWTSMNSLTLLPPDHNANVSFAVPTDFYQQFRDLDVKVRLTLAFTYFQDANRRTFVVPSGAFTLPDAGRCTATPLDPPNVYSGGPKVVFCLAPLHRPASLFLNLKLSDSTCKRPPGRPSVSASAFGTEWIQNSDSPEFGISPVVQFELAPFQYHNISTSEGLPDGMICPGTPLTLSNPQKVGDIQITQQLDNVHLPDNGSLRPR